MAARKKPQRHSRSASAQKRFGNHGFYTPFADLDQQLEKIACERDRQEGADSHEALSRVADYETVQLEDVAVFYKAMADVKPLKPGKAEIVPKLRCRRAAPRFLAQEEHEVLTHLSELVRGEGAFEVSFSDEYLDGAVVGLSPSVLKKLRNGDFSCQKFLDLHGYTRVQAQQKVTKFVINMHLQGIRCVLIICGRGLNSKNREPVLKQHLVRWFTRSPLKQVILAFSCARSYDGGAGAFYVLLRRRKGQNPVISPAC